jgi:hypothetical protein
MKGLHCTYRHVHCYSTSLWDCSCHRSGNIQSVRQKQGILIYCHSLDLANAGNLIEVSMAYKLQVVMCQNFLNEVHIQGDSCGAWQKTYPRRARTWQNLVYNGARSKVGVTELHPFFKNFILELVFHINILRHYQLYFDFFNRELCYLTTCYQLLVIIKDQFFGYFTTQRQMQRPVYVVSNETWK